VSYLRTVSTEALEPQATVTYLEPPISPTPIGRPAPAPAPAPPPVAPAPPPAPVAVQPAPMPAPVPPPAPVAAMPEPVAPQAPVAPPPPPPAPVQHVEPTPSPVDQTVALFLHLTSGERIWAGRYDTDALAEENANELVRNLVRPEPGVWARFGNRLIRPDAVVSIEFAARRAD
jgi:outer membrane biosynthesis protein TonB